MQVDRITFTGADDRTSLLDLSNVSAICPFVEWGILFSKSKKGQSRYPSNEKIRYFSAMGIPMSAHFCGWYSKEVLEKKNYGLIERLEGFDRVQINYNFLYSVGWDLESFLSWIVKHPEKSIIFQYNKSNAHPLEFLYGQNVPPNIHFLYDSSGGRGTVINSIQPPFKGVYTGYSGGLTPENIADKYRRISEFDSPDKVWLDMESGVRTDDSFDIKKCLSVLNQITEENKLAVS